MIATLMAEVNSFLVPTSGLGKEGFSAFAGGLEAAQNVTLSVDDTAAQQLRRRLVRKPGRSLMSQIKLERNPSIRSCFSERFTGSGSFNGSQQNSLRGFTISQDAHVLPRPPTSLPQSPVDKHLIVEQPVSTRISTSPLVSAASSLQTVTINFSDHTNNQVGSPPIEAQNKFPPGCFSAPLPPIPSFLKIRKNITPRMSLYAPLYRAAMKGDWEEAKEFLKSHPGAINVRITKGMDTVLHIAAGAKNTKFVEEVVKLMTSTDLALRNKYCNTALCYAAASGITRIAEVMVNKNKDLPVVRGGKGVTPLYVAAMFGHRDMVWYLYRVTSYEDLTQEDRIGLLIATISNDLFDVALCIIQREPELAIQQDPNGETALHVLARKPSAFASTSGLRIWQRFIYPWIHVELPSKTSSFSSISRRHISKISQVFLCLTGQLWHAIEVIAPGIKLVREKKLHHMQALELVKLLWDQVLSVDDSQTADFLTNPSQPLFLAAKFGIVELVTELLCSYPDLIWNIDKERRSIFHIAVVHRQEKIFNLIHDTGAHKDMITSYKDINDHNMLHLAGKLAPLDQLNIVSGAALQMQRELLWFKEVERNVQPLSKEMKDKTGRTPRMLFIEEHRGLVKEGEKWMKNTASSCMLVATLITTVMFAAIFTVPGGDDDIKGTPIFLQSNSFVIFAVSDAIALFSSVTSILMFLSILTSRYAAEDFLESLPRRLIVGLATLFCSIASMLVAFGATFCIVLGQRLAWIVVPIALISCIPVTLFAFLQFPLLADMIHSSYGVGIFAPKNKHMLY